MHEGSRMQGGGRLYGTLAASAASRPAARLLVEVLVGIALLGAVWAVAALRLPAALDREIEAQVGSLLRGGDAGGIQVEVSDQVVVLTAPTGVPAPEPGLLSQLRAIPEVSLVRVDQQVDPAVVGLAAGRPPAEADLVFAPQALEVPVSTEPEPPPVQVAVARTEPPAPVASVPKGSAPKASVPKASVPKATHPPKAPASPVVRAPAAPEPVKASASPAPPAPPEVVAAPAASGWAAVQIDPEGQP